MANKEWEKKSYMESYIANLSEEERKEYFEKIKYKEAMTESYKELHDAVDEVIKNLKELK